MKSYQGFFAGCVIGAAAVGFVCWLHLANVRSNIEGSVLRETHNRLQDRHVANIIDCAQLALMLRAIEPDLEPVWMEETLLYHARDIAQDFRGNIVAHHALNMIRGYYIKNNLPVPREISQIFQSFADDLNLSRQNSDFAVADTFKERLQAFDDLMAAKRQRQSNDFVPTAEPEATGIRMNGLLKNAVSF